MWVPREYQGEGRHDAPDRYGALYVAESPVSAVAEQLARFRGRRLRPEMLSRRGHRLVLARYELADRCELVDLDDPGFLVRETLRPSRVATRRRQVTRTIAASLYSEHPDAGGLRWWSTLEASWINVTLFAERVRSELRALEPVPLTREVRAVGEACQALGLPTE
jgi:hypothetical protein